MDKQQLKQILISILIGAIIAFFQTFFEGLTAYLKTHNEQIISSAAGIASYIALHSRHKV